MTLNINDDQVIESPNLEAIVKALQNLDQEEFLILATAEEHYVQALLDSDDTYVLEYRDGSEDRHFGADPDAVKLADVCRAFELFLGGQDLAPLLDWEKLDP
ncbi:MAG: hypothetical protein K0Q72_2451 [Armatimonadetes bacterium]|jgi:hypothetical protein|nr:hypothetical protein [Armatimonadota bacterium]